MEELFVNKTTYDYNLFLALTQVNMTNKSKKKSSKAADIFFSVSLIVFLLAVVIDMILNGDFPWGLIILLVIVLLPLLLVKKFLSAEAMAKRTYRTQKDIADKEVIFLFYEGSFRAVYDISDSTNLIGDIEYYWKEDENYFFLSRDKKAFWVIAKSGFEKGTADEFRLFLQSKPMFTVLRKKTK